MEVGIASSGWHGLAELPFSAYMRFARHVGAEVIDTSVSVGRPQSRPHTLHFDTSSVAQLRAEIKRVGVGIAAVGGPDAFTQRTPDEVAEHVALVTRLSDCDAAPEVPVDT